MRITMKSLLLWLAIVSLMFAESEVSAQQKDTQSSNPYTSAPQSSPTPASQDIPSDSPKTLEDTINASEDDEPPRRKLVRWNEYQGPHFTLQFGAGILYDYAHLPRIKAVRDRSRCTPVTRFALDTTGSFSASTSIISTSVDYNRSRGQIF